MHRINMTEEGDVLLVLLYKEADKEKLDLDILVG